MSTDPDTRYDPLGGHRAESIGPWLQRAATIEDLWTTQDSGCRSWRVRWPDGAHDFIKVADTDDARRGLARARVLHEAVRHPALVAPRRAVELADGGTALVFDAVAGEVLYDTRRFTSAQRLTDPRSAAARLRQLPTRRIEAVIDTIFEVHLAVTAAGFTAIDFYDGCVLYDFDTHTTRLVDFDEYRPGPVIVPAPRLPSSRRFMSPEELEPGARVDEISNVFMLGRVAIELLGDGHTSPERWRGTPGQLTTARRAATADRRARHPRVQTLVADWRG